MNSSGPIISKSKFLSGLQCPLLLWTQYNDKDLIPPPDASTQALFDMGHRIGDLAKRLYLDGIEVEPRGDRLDLASTVADTARFLPQRRPIFEASFLADEPSGQRYVRADILVPAADGAWDLIEVKSSTKVKPVNVWDVAFQAGALEHAGLRLNRLSLMHIDNTYVRRGTVEPARLFQCADITEPARERIPHVPAMFAQYAGTITGNRPDIPIGPHCTDPYDCAMLDVCWRNLPAHHVTETHRAGRQAFAWMAQGCELLTDVADDRLSSAQRVQKAAVARNEVQVAPGSVQQLLASLEYPLWHLDFESANPAVPLFDGTRPYQQIPFQFSLHVQDGPDDPPRHIEHLGTEPVDPRPGLLEALTAIEPRGSVLAFNAGFESRVLEDLGATYPESRDLTDNLRGRLLDLAKPFRTLEIYHPAQRGRYSLKAVLPAFTGISYDDLEIADGQAAGREWLRVVFGEDIEAADKAAVMDQLRRYCGQDTWAMVALLREMQRLAG